MAPTSCDPVFFPLKRRLPSSETGEMLGRVVRHFQDPTFDYTPASPSAAVTPDVYKSFLMTPQYENAAKITSKASRDSSLLAKLQGLLSISASSGAGGSSTITSPRVTIRRLRLEPDYFAALKENPSVRSKILEMCPVGGKVYLVVGIMSFHTAGVQQEGTQRKETKSKVVVAAGTAAATAGGMPFSAMKSGAGNLEFDSAYAASSDWTIESTVTAVGEAGEDETAEEIFALAYRVINRDWMGMGKDVQIKQRTPVTSGGQHFNTNDSSDEGDSEGEEDELVAAQGLRLLTEEISPAIVGNFRGESAVLDREGGFLYFPKDH